MLCMHFHIMYMVLTKCTALSGGRIVRAPGRATYTCMPPWNGFETRHGLMPNKCLNIYPIEDDGP